METRLRAKLTVAPALTVPDIEDGQHHCIYSTVTGIGLRGRNICINPWESDLTFKVEGRGMNREIRLHLDVEKGSIWKETDVGWQVDQR